ncbi:MAG: ketol-acid reductoisomerase [Planctomycetaceae bacterium]|nr:ketol-acid reductoisomerase [Planctomycetaceae bacterium]MCA9043680.1 ketol-acid reductoisomerase [Planctomycetaceae bacterium]MCB9952747.1 ketol-acid reductoisomerase [Planctomycetaceae bacterium]
MNMKLLGDADASLDALSNQTVAILGYGNQGRAQALNLRDSGVQVIVGNRDDEYFQHAVDDNFAPMSISEAAKAGDVLLILTTDESQPLIWNEQIAPGLEAGNALVWASGYNVGYGLITPPEDVDVLMVAPRMTGHMVRKLFENGKGAIAQFAVHQDATGNARDRVLALCKGEGLTRGGVFESSFREEAELDLFAEQVVWPVLAGWIRSCFDLGVEFGFSPELMVMELYASGETSEITGAMARNGFFRQMSHHSTTSQYGTLSRGPMLVTDAMRQKARELFQRDIREGAFVKEWSAEQANGSQELAALMKDALSHKMSQAELGVIGAIQGAHSLEKKRD